MPIIFLTIFILGPISIVHLLLHFFLKFWRKNPKGIYIAGFFAWTVFLFIAWHLAKISSVVFTPPRWLIVLSAITVWGAFFLLVWAIFALGAKRFFLLVMLKPKTAEQKYIKSGPYRLLPHPAYTAYIAAAIAAFFATGYTVLLVFMIFNIIAMTAVIYLENHELARRLKNFQRLNAYAKDETDKLH